MIYLIVLQKKHSSPDCSADRSSSYDDVLVSISEVENAINELKRNKSCGLDGIVSEHLKFAHRRLSVLLSICFSSFLVHGVLPDKLMSVVLVPVIKDKSRKISCIDNYRPIALSSVLSKVLEIIIRNRILDLLSTQPNQFGFKKKVGTDQCKYVLKEIIDAYMMLNSSVFVCFLDASKAFDRVNHGTLFWKLVNRGVPYYIVRLLVYWYSNQTMCVRWGNAISDVFKTSNGVRQGSVLSPFLFNVYVDSLSEILNQQHIGCFNSGELINHLLYADDLCLISPSVNGLNISLSVFVKSLVLTMMLFIFQRKVLLNTSNQSSW